MRQPIALALLCAAVADTATKPHTLVLYAYSQHSAEAVANVRYFLRFGLSNATDATFVFVVNGCHSVQFPADRPNVIVVQRPNTCFDFGAWGVGLEAAEAAGVAYDFVVLLNGSVRGPFLPAYERRPWWRVFTDGLSVADAPGLLGTTANCADLDASDARSAHVQSMVLAMTRPTLKFFSLWFAMARSDSGSSVCPPARAVCTTLPRPMEWPEWDIWDVGTEESVGQRRRFAARAVARRPHLQTR